MKKFLVSLFILFIFITSCFAYTIEVKTYTTLDRYEKVVRHSFTEDYLVIYILDSFDNFKIMIKKNNIISIKIEY